MQLTRRHRHRFHGAGRSAEREFNRQLRQNIRETWIFWTIAIAFVVGTAIYSFYVGRVPGRLLAAVSGFGVGVLTVVASLGGHISAYRWWLGAEGERLTGKQIERLSGEWHCEHDLEHEHGNYDHVLVGPAGIFLLDSKLLHGAARAGEDALRSGRVVYSGNRFRAAAKRVNVELQRRLGTRAQWVQSVVVIWGDFPQERHEDQDVTYVRGEQLVSWLTSLPEKMNAPQRAAYVTALREVRNALTKHSA